DEAGRLDDFLRAYVRAYEARDLPQMARMFAPDALLNGEHNREAILSHYHRFFEEARNVSFRARRVGTRETEADGAERIRAVFRLRYDRARSGAETGGSAREPRE